MRGLALLALLSGCVASTEPQPPREPGQHIVGELAALRVDGSVEHAAVDAPLDCHPESAVSCWTADEHMTVTFAPERTSLAGVLIHGDRQWQYTCATQLAPTEYECTVFRVVSLIQRVDPTYAEWHPDRPRTVLEHVTEVAR